MQTSEQSRQIPLALLEGPMCFAERIMMISMCRANPASCRERRSAMSLQQTIFDFADATPSDTRGRLFQKMGLISVTQ
jgi:hypothetical protein